LFNALMAHLLTATDARKTKQNVKLDAQKSVWVATFSTVLMAKMSSAMHVKNQKRIAKPNAQPILLARKSL